VGVVGEQLIFLFCDLVLTLYSLVCGHWICRQT